MGPWSQGRSGLDSWFWTLYFAGMSIIIPKPLPFEPGALDGISLDTNVQHHDALYVGYVNKRNEIEAALETADRSKAAATYSPFRELKLEETFNINGQLLHECFFDNLGGKGAPPTGALHDQLVADFGSWSEFVADLVACSLAARGWAVMAWDPSDGKIRNFLCDAHNQGGVWGAVPLLVVDVYEHSYILDHGADRKAYLEAVLRNLNWARVKARFEAIQR